MYSVYVKLSPFASVALAVTLIDDVVLLLNAVDDITGATFAVTVFCVAVLLLVFPALSVTITLKSYVVSSANPVYLYVHVPLLVTVVVAVV